MRSLRTSLALLLTSLLLWTGSVEAEAKTYYWNKTYVAHGSVKLKFCDGEVAVFKKGNRTTKNVCAVWLPVDGYILAFVRETGTILFEVCNVDDAHWKRFNSRTDTGRTAEVHSYKGFHCV